MKVFLVSARSDINAIGDYDLEKKTLIVLKGSRVSPTIAYSETFRGSKSIEKHRKGVLKDNVLQQDVSFKSASAAANFVTGYSTNGLTAWKNKDGKPIKEVISETEE